METEINNLYIDINKTGIEGAMVAMKQGEIAAYQILGCADKVKSVQNELLQERREATIQFMNVSKKDEIILMICGSLLRLSKFYLLIFFPHLTMCYTTYWSVRSIHHTN